MLPAHGIQQQRQVPDIPGHGSADSLELTGAAGALGYEADGGPHTYNAAKGCGYAERASQICACTQPHLWHADKWLVYLRLYLWKFIVADPHEMMAHFSQQTMALVV